jgi:hypothetical protein
MAGPETVDRLPPETRFALRALAAGLPLKDAAELMRLDAPTMRKRLRTAARRFGASPPPPDEGDAALLAALAPALAAAGEPATKPSSKHCPAPDVAAALAAGQLDGPLMLAEIDHAADCPACLSRLVALRRAGVQPAPREAARSPWPIVIGAAAGLGAAVWYLLAR